MREQELWRRLNRHIGAGLVPSWVDHVVLAGLDNRTVTEAMAAGVPTRQVWLAVWSFLELPDSER